jgi:hypothetical protein
MVDERTRLIRPIDGAALPVLVQKLVCKFVSGFYLQQTVSEPTLVTYASHGVSIRRERHEHSYEDSVENWWPTSHWWECHISGIPGVEKFSLFAGTSSPGAEEVYNFFECAADSEVEQKLLNQWRVVQLEHLMLTLKVRHSTLMPQAWQDFFMKSRELTITGAFDWLREYRLAQGEDLAPLLFSCEGKNWLATADAGEPALVRGALPADPDTVKATRQRSHTGAEPHGLELALRLLPNETGWSDLFHETEGDCFLSAAWGEKIPVKGWHNDKWLMRQSIGGNKWGGLRSAYWLQPYGIADAARFSMLAMFEIYGGGATMSFKPEENNTQYFYSVVSGINPAEKSAFLVHLDAVLEKDGWQKE